MLPTVGFTVVQFNQVQQPVMAYGIVPEAVSQPPELVASERTVSVSCRK